MPTQTYTPSSSAIASVQFQTDEDDDTTGTAYVTFVKGGSITIENFPAIEIERWMNSPSVGGYWNTVLRGQY